MLLGVIGAVGLWSVVVVLPAVEADFGVSRGDASMAYTITMLGFALGNVVMGRGVDRFGITRVAIASAIILAVGFSIAASASNYWVFVACQGLFIGVGTAATFGPLMASVSLWFKKRRGIAVAATASGNYLAGTVWPLVIEPLMASYDWRVAYYVIAVSCLVGMIPLAFGLRAKPPEEEEVSQVTGKAPGSRITPINLSPRLLIALLAVAGLGCCVAMSMPQVHIVAYSADLGHGVARGAEMLSLMLAAGVISRLASGFLADYIGGVRTLILGSVLQCVALLLYIPFDGLVSLYVVSLVFGLSQGGIVPSYAIIVREFFPSKEAGQKVGIVMMSTIIGMALGGWLSGYIFDLTGSYQAAFLNGIAWNLLNIGICLTLILRSRPKQPAFA